MVFSVNCGCPCSRGVVLWGGLPSFNVHCIEVCLQLLNGFDKPYVCIDRGQNERTDAIKYCSEIWRKFKITSKVRFDVEHSWVNSLKI